MQEPVRLTSTVTSLKRGAESLLTPTALLCQRLTMQEIKGFLITHALILSISWSGHHTFSGTGTVEPEETLTHRGNINTLGFCCSLLHVSGLT